MLGTLLLCIWCGAFWGIPVERLLSSGWRKRRMGHQDLKNLVVYCTFQFLTAWGLFWKFHFSEKCVSFRLALPTYSTVILHRNENNPWLIEATVCEQSLHVWGKQYIHILLIRSMSVSSKTSERRLGHVSFTNAINMRYKIWFYFTDQAKGSYLL